MFFFRQSKVRSVVQQLGPDGVSKSDVLALPQSAHECFVQMYKDIESMYRWPLQLTVGIVSSLEKKPGALQTSE